MPPFTFTRRCCLLSPCWEGSMRSAPWRRCCARAVNWLNQTILNDLQLKLFTHLQRMPHSFYARAKVGDLMTRLTDDLDNVQSALSQLTNKTLYQSFQLIGGILGLFLTLRFSVLTLLILMIV